MQEYDRQDANFYDYYSLGIPGDVEFYVDEAKKAGSPVLEIGCGTGRILIPTAQAGISITGLDRAPSMLDILRNKITDLDKNTQSRIQIVEGDMRDFSLKEKFKLVTIPYRAFLHLLTSEDQI
ncbi:class I SAM-dependent methyltransferase [Candidatus Sumerlaeota bacterium]|nr:class I SAM-dependent methyltransferase [Candidatus Sumerlaeota bacterium]